MQPRFNSGVASIWQLRTKEIDIGLVQFPDEGELARALRKCVSAGMRPVLPALDERRSLGCKALTAAGLASPTKHISVALNPIRNRVIGSEWGHRLSEFRVL